MPDKRRAVFLDRDGTLMEEVHYCRDPQLVKSFPGCEALLRRLREKNWLVIIITNQSGIGRGLFTEQQFQEVQTELLRQLGGQVDATYWCADHPDRPSHRRKPSPGMLLEAAADWNIDLRKSWMIGDKDIDVQAGLNAGTQAAMVRTGYGNDFAVSEAPYLVFADVCAALNYLLEITDHE